MDYYRGLLEQLILMSTYFNATEAGSHFSPNRLPAQFRSIAELCPVGTMIQYCNTLVEQPLHSMLYYTAWQLVEIRDFATLVRSIL